MVYFSDIQKNQCHKRKVTLQILNVITYEMAENIQISLIHPQTLNSIISLRKVSQKLFFCFFYFFLFFCCIFFVFSCFFIFLFLIIFLFF